MGKIDQHQINVFVNDGNGNPISGAEIRAFDGDEEVGRAKMGSTSNAPGRFTFSPEYESVRFDVTVPGLESKSQVVGVDVGNYTFTFEDYVPKEKKPVQSSEASKHYVKTGHEIDQSGGSLDARLLTTLGKIAGLGGVSIGIFFLLIRNLIEGLFTKSAEFSGDQAYHATVALMVLVFGIAAIGIVAWVIGRFADKTRPVSRTALAILAVLILAVLASSIVVLADFPSHRDVSATKPEPQKPQVQNPSGAPVPSQNTAEEKKSSVRKTGDPYIDNVVIKIYTGEKDPHWPEGKRASALEGLFERGAFSCASTESWPEMLWAASATRIVLHNNIPAFQQHPNTRNSLNKAAGILLKMEGEMAPLWGDSFDPTDIIHKHINNHDDFIHGLPSMVNTPDDEMQSKRRQNVNLLRKALKGYVPLASDELCQ